MTMNRHQTISIFVVLLFGFILFFTGTDGFQAITAEGARVNSLIEEKPKFPEVILEDSNGRSYPFTEFENKYVFITFFYSYCPVVCIDLEKNMAEVYSLIPEQYVGEDILFLSISFDTERDDPSTLNKYKDYFNSDGLTWRMARIPDQDELNTLLERFGVIVIPDEYGGFAHNSAFYLVDHEGALIDVMDYKKPEQAAATVLELLEQEKGE